MSNQPDDLITELLQERFGPGVPWRERTNKPSPMPREDDLVKARRRRALNEALDDVPQHFRRGRRAA